MEEGFKERVVNRWHVRRDFHEAVWVVLCRSNRWVICDSRLGELLGSDLVCDVGPGQCTTVNSEALTNSIREQENAVGSYVDALDAGHCTSVRQTRTVELVADVGDELMRDIEDQQGGIRGSDADVRSCDHVLREWDGGEVFDVLV